MTYSSPRQNHLQQAATTILSKQDPAPSAIWDEYQQPLQLILQTCCMISDKSEEFWKPMAPYFRRQDFAAGTELYRVDDTANNFYMLESGMLKAKYDLPQGKYSEIIVAGTTCGELPFFSSTARTSTTSAERDCVTWALTQQRWAEMQKDLPTVSQELLKCGLKLTSERMEAITKYAPLFYLRESFN